MKKQELTIKETQAISLEILQKYVNHSNFDTH